MVYFIVININIKIFIKIMNLYENIQRIQSLLTENKEEIIKNMIDKHGLNHVIKLMGGYDSVLNSLGREYFTNDVKLKYVKEKVNELCDEYGSGVALTEIDESPIFYDETEDGIRQIEYLSKNKVYVDVYEGNGHTHVGDFTVMYENLPTQILNELFEMLINQ